MGVRASARELDMRLKHLVQAVVLIKMILWRDTVLLRYCYSLPCTKSRFHLEITLNTGTDFAQLHTPL